MNPEQNHISYIFTNYFSNSFTKKYSTTWKQRNFKHFSMFQEFSDIYLSIIYNHFANYKNFGSSI